MQGIPLNRTTMASWAIICAQTYLAPEYEYFQRELLMRRFLMMDETPIQVLKEPERRAQSKSCIWMIRSGEDGEPSIVLYHYTMTRAGDNAAEFLDGIEPGYYYMADGYGGYNKLTGGKRCCCYAHIRRYFHDAIPQGHEKDYTNPAVQGMLYCNKLFEYERTYREKGLNWKARQKRRIKDELPVIEAFERWLDRQQPEKGSRFEKAINYSQNQRKYFRTYLEDGRCSLSNNLSENSLRVVTVGRKNWLFSDTQDGANASMIIYTMIEMAKAHGLDPYLYLKYLLDRRVKDGAPDEALEQLAPWSQAVQDTCKRK